MPGSGKSGNTQGAPKNGRKHADPLATLRRLTGGARTDRDFRLAALNLIEDAQSARREQQRASADRMRAEESLAHSEEKLRLIIENARDYAIFSMDLDRRVLTWNSGAEKILGYSESEIIGRFGDIIFTEEDRAAGAPKQESQTALREGRALDDGGTSAKTVLVFGATGL